ncbi:glycosyltransferase family 4 protein [Turicibacter sp. TS3]|uniref:glycosyltransferase family 4 protein n=1 Tax=Turicibacter sp. TS3 TaxID=2304578 RepID=UPI001379BE43|nr:glycosyltransferase family 4 protein [Turicibacter sp. TS3]NCE77810.1 glycosyltransferase [Turicibacter sp. TS3]
MKRILYVRNGPYKVNPNLYNLQEIGFCKELCKLGYNCDIIYYSDENKDEVIYEYNNYRVKLLWRKGIKILRTGLYPRLLKKSFVNQYDLIITTEYSQIMSLLWTLFNPPVVLYNGPYYNLFKVACMEKLYDFLFVKLLNKRLSKIFVKSPLSKGYLEKKGFKKVEVLGVGLDTSVFDEITEIPQNVGKLMEFMQNNECILYVGSLDKRKNFEFTLKVFEEVKKLRKDIQLIVVGKGKSNYVTSCLNKVDNENRSSIVLMEKIDNRFLKHIYSNATVFILPSKQEIFGMVLLEAMYFGVPTISSKNGGSTTLIRNKVNGIIEDDFSINNWAQDIMEILNNVAYKDSLRFDAKKTINENFTWKVVVNKFLKEVDKIK